jgi:hypothetical protein
MKHLSETELALVAGGETRDWRSHWHGKVCARCRAKVAEYRALRQGLCGRTEDFRLPKGYDWAEMEAEMMGNIRLGVEVASVTPPARRREPREWMDWRGLVAIGALMAVVMTGWFLAGPARQASPRFPGMSQLTVMAVPVPASTGASAAAENAVRLEANPMELGFREGAEGLYFRSAAPTSTRVAASLDGTLRSATVDQESGQISITQVTFSDNYGAEIYEE